jgi:SpoVK/Ycf46/Vps4 family AAA+-type ATPase
MRNSGIMGDDVPAKLGDIAQVTDGYSGADFEGLPKVASSIAIMRRMDSSSSKNNTSQQSSDTLKLKVGNDRFVL